MKKENHSKKIAVGYDPDKVLEFNEENRHLFSEEAILFFEKAERGEIFSPKYLRLLNDIVKERAQEAFEKDPDQPIKKVAFAILGPLPDRLPPNKLSELFQLILEEWKQLQTEHAVSA